MVVNCYAFVEFRHILGIILIDFIINVSPMNSKQIAYSKNIQNRIKFHLFCLLKFPSLLFWGLRVKKLEKNSCSVGVSYNYRTKNPFQSVYFAVSAAAAELSTGVLVQRAITGEGKWSMIVASHESQFTKKGLGKLRFECHNGKELWDFIKRLKTEKVGTITLQSIGYDEAGDEIGRFAFTWRLKYYE